MPTRKRTVFTKDKDVAVGATKGPTLQIASKLNLLAKALNFNALQIDIYVQVLDEDGDPKTSLNRNDFRVWRGVVEETIHNFTPQPVQALPGLYVLSVQNNLPSVKGQYIYAVKVRSKSWTLVDVMKL